MIVNKAEKFPILSTEEISTLSSTGSSLPKKKEYDVVSSFQGDPFVGHLSTPITTSNLTSSKNFFIGDFDATRKTVRPLEQVHRAAGNDKAEERNRHKGEGLVLRCAHEHGD